MKKPGKGQGNCNIAGDEDNSKMNSQNFTLQLESKDDT